MFPQAPLGGDSFSEPCAVLICIEELCFTAHSAAFFSPQHYIFQTIHVMHVDLIAFF